MSMRSLAHNRLHGIVINISELCKPFMFVERIQPIFIKFRRKTSEEDKNLKKKHKKTETNSKQNREKCRKNSQILQNPPKQVKWTALNPGHRYIEKVASH